MYLRPRSKRLVTILIVAAAALFITGCTQNNTPEQSQEITLQWWGVFLDENTVASLIKEYEDQNAGVKIDYANRWPGGKSELAASLYKDELNRVLREGNSVSIPDIFMLENTWVGDYESFTATAPTDVIDANTVKTAYYPFVAQDFAHGDQVRGLPMWADTLAVLYNKTILASGSVSTPPTDWVNFKQLALNLTQKSAGTISRGGFSAGRASNVSSAAELFNLLLLQNGVGIVNANGEPNFSTDADSQTALNFYKSFEGTAAGSWDSSFENDALAFLQGKLGMMVAPSWRYNDILTFNDKYNLGLNIGVAPMPQLQGQTIPVINWATYWGNVVAQNRPNASASWKFLNWLSQPDQMRKLNANLKLNRKFFGILYPRIDMQQELQTDQYLRVYNSALSTAQTWYMVKGQEVQAVFNDMLDKAVSQSLISQAENEIQRLIRNKGKL